MKMLEFIGKAIAFFQEASTRTRVVLVLGAFLVFGAVQGALVKIGLIKDDPPPKQQVVAAAPAAPEPKRDPEPIIVVRQYLRHHLNDWDSYDNDGFGQAESIAPHNGAPAWRVRHEYRAKNGFGAMMLNDQMFYYTADGVYQVIDAR